MFFVLIIFVSNADSRRISKGQKYYLRNLLDKFKNKLPIDFRRFDKENMLLFPDVGFQSLTDEKTWKLIVHGWRYEDSKKKDWLGFSTSRWIERIAKQMLNQNDLLYLNGSINRDRLKPFFVQDDSNEVIQVKIGDQTFRATTDYEGQLYEQFEMTNDAVQVIKNQQQLTRNAIMYEAIGDNKDTTKGIIQLIEPRQGISVVSDIDDTIKISEVLDKVRLLANTFIHPFKAVPGKCKEKETASINQYKYLAFLLLFHRHG